MTLVDTSVWVDHFRKDDEDLLDLLAGNAVFAHPFVIGEIALGSLRNRRAVLASLHDLPQAPLATDEEVLRLVESRTLFGSGIGYIDAHLLASALLSGSGFWTRDKRLSSVASAIGLAVRDPH